MLGLTTILREKEATLFSVAGSELVTANCWATASLGGFVASLTVRLVRAPKPAVLRVISPLVLPELNVTTGWPLHFFDVRLV